MYQVQVSFKEAINMAFNKYCYFSGRASRSEYWWFGLFGFILGMVVNIVLGIFGAGPNTIQMITGLISLALFLPNLGLCVRRLHDIGKGGGWIFINLIPIVGSIIYIVWMCKPSEVGDNRFGSMPNLVAAQ